MLTPAGEHGLGTLRRDSRVASASRNPKQCDDAADRQDAGRGLRDHGRKSQRIQLNSGEIARFVESKPVELRRRFPCLKTKLQDRADVARRAFGNAAGSDLQR